MKRLNVILFLLIAGVSVSFAQKKLKHKSERQVEKWTVAGDEVEELLEELGIENDVDMNFNDDDQVEIIRIEKNKPHPSMFFLKGGEDMDMDLDFDFDFDIEDLEGLQELKKFKLKMDGGEGIQEFEWDGEGDMPEDMLKLFKNMHENLEWNGDRLNFDQEHFNFDNLHMDNKRPLLGVFAQEQDDQKGLMINKIVKGSGAEKAGLKEGDVLLEIDGQSLNSVSQLVDIIQDHELGDHVKVTYERGDKKKSTNAELGESKEHHNFPHAKKRSRAFGENPACHPQKMRKPRLGVQFSHTSEGPQKKLVIDEVIPGTTAEAAGLKAGDQIIAFNNQELSGHRSLIEELNKVEKGEKVAIKVLRDNKEMTLTAEMKSEKNQPFMKRKFKNMQGDHFMDMDSDGGSDEDIIIIRKKRTNVTPNNANGQELNLEVYPNPSAGSVRLKFTGDEAQTQIRIYDAQGKEYYNETLIPDGGYIDQTIKLEGNPQGALYLSLKNGDELVTQKLILQK